MVYHLSHIDLDGYFCQFLSTKKYKAVKYFNSNYGKEILLNLKKIFKQASLSDSIIITDLNLEQKECEYVQSFIDKGYNVKLYDHHIAGKKYSERYEWYYLDSTKSASLILSEALEINCPIVHNVNSYDMWIEDENLDLGCYLSEFINKDFLFYFNEDRIKFFNSFFQNVCNIREPLSVEKLESAEVIILQGYFSDYKGTLKQRISQKYYDDMPRFSIKGKYIFLFEINREYFQYISQLVLKDEPNLIVVLISKNGRLSFRSKVEDVNQLSYSYFNGSGHKNASGGTLIERKISNKEEGVSSFLNTIGF